VFFDPVAKPLSASKFLQTAIKKGITLSSKTRMLYAGKHLFVNGEPLSMPRQDKTSLTALANARQLAGDAIAACSEDATETFYQWYKDGWISLSK
jgi:50S ribosomal protein L16 3-hydroxylase